MHTVRVNLELTKEERWLNGEWTLSSQMTWRQVEIQEQNNKKTK